MGTRVRRYAWSMVIALLVLGALGVASPAPVTAAPQSYIVTTNTDTVNDTNCIVGSCTLRQAVNASNANDPGAGQNTITFAGAVTGTITLNAGFSTLQLNKSVAITGPSASILTVSGGGSFALADLINSTPGALVFSVAANVTASISGLTIADGVTFQLEGLPGLGGGIRNVGGTLNLDKVAITRNFANNGGGIHNDGILTITNSTISGNVAGLGAGIDIGATGNPNQILIVNSTISGNVATAPPG